MSDADLTEWDHLALSKLTKLIGEDRGRDLYRETLRELRLVGLRSARDLLLFAEALRRHGGFIEAMGGLLRVKAILGGAEEKIR